MASVGNRPTTAHFPIDLFSGNDSTTDFVLSQVPGSTSAIDVHIGSVYQVPSTAYTVSGTTIAFTSAPPTGTNNIVVVHKGVQVQIPTPADGSVGIEQLQVSQFGGEYIKLSDVKTSGTAGGTFTSGAWQTRDLNTEDNDTGNHCSLSTNQFTLDTGTYRILASAPSVFVSAHKLKLYNITDASDEIIGVAEYSHVANNGTTRAFVFGEFTITAAKVFELQHRCAVTRSTDGLGLSAGFGVSEVYSTVELWKVK